MTTAARRLLFGLLGLVLAAPALAQAPAQTPPPATPKASGPVYIVAYFETEPAASSAAAQALRRFAVSEAKQAGSKGVLALREARRPGRFAIVETWRDQAALEAGRGALGTLSASFGDHLTAPFDIRPCVALDVAGPDIGVKPPPPRGRIVLTHIDVVPTRKDAGIALVKDLVAASRKEPGQLFVDALQQGGRPNHMFLVEAWDGRASFNAHIAAASTRMFRSKLLPLQGALFDERVYEAIR